MADPMKGLRRDRIVRLLDGFQSRVGTLGSFQTSIPDRRLLPAAVLELRRSWQCSCIVSESWKGRSLIVHIYRSWGDMLEIHQWL